MNNSQIWKQRIVGFIVGSFVVCTGLLIYSQYRMNTDGAVLRIGFLEGREVSQGEMNTLGYLAENGVTDYSKLKKHQ